MPNTKNKKKLHADKCAGNLLPDGRKKVWDGKKCVDPESLKYKGKIDEAAEKLRW